MIETPHKSGWARFGLGLKRNQAAVRAVQWCCAVVYAGLLLGAWLFPTADSHAYVMNGIAAFTEALFWGVWWPLAILSVLVCGQFWCGVFCPEGMLSERAGLFGPARKIPRAMRWPLWPLLLFCAVKLHEHVHGVFARPGLMLLTLGGTTGMAVLIGYVYGRGKRVWCRYLCPVGGIFSLLARCALLHFRVDRQRWDAAPRTLAAVDCPLLLDVRNLRSNTQCSMCGRCSGYRDAVELAARPPGAELAAMRDDEVRLWDGFAICYILFGFSHAVVHAGSGAESVRPILLTSLALGTLLAAPLWLGARGDLRRAAQLSHVLIPLAGLGLFLGAVERHSLAVLLCFGIEPQGWLPYLRAFVLTLGCVWSLGLARALRRGPSGLCHTEAVALAAAAGLLAASYQLAPCAS